MAAKKEKKREKKRINRGMQKKLVILFAVVSLALIGLIVRLTYIERTSSERYQKIVLSQQEYDSKTIPYQRGDITDRKGTVLATSTDVYNVILDCNVLLAKEETVEPTLAALAQCFPELDMNDVRRRLAENPDSRYAVLLKKLPYSEVQPFVEMQDDNENYPDLSSGVWFEKEYERQYPYGAMGSSLVGFIASGNVGMAGVENSYNSVLNGVNGREYGYLNADNNFEKTIKEAVDGKDVVLTMDANIQGVVEEKIQNFQTENANVARPGAGSTHTAAIVMDPNNGEILAMAQYPNYNSADPWDLSAYYSLEQQAMMTDDDKLNALNGLWQNYCLTATYEPGSTSKPFTVACGLETGALSGNETYVCDGYEEISGYKIHCVSRMGHGLETIEQSIMNSCNDALMQMSYVIGPENFTKYQHIFGFGLKTNIDLPGEARTDSLIYSLKDMTTIDLATNSFGQNYNCTMIQMASAFSSLINGGYYYQPHVMKKITDAEGNTVEEFGKKLIKQTISENTSEMIKSYLYATVSGGGTGKSAKVTGYSMGGKTGTAQKVPRDGINYLVSFIGYIPADHPKAVVYVVVDEPNAEEQYHSTFAMAIAKEIFTDILPYLNIYPDEMTPEEYEAAIAAEQAAAAEEAAAAAAAAEAAANAPADGTVPEVVVPEVPVVEPAPEESAPDAPASDLMTTPTEVLPVTDIPVVPELLQ